MWFFLWSCTWKKAHTRTHRGHIHPPRQSSEVCLLWRWMLCAAYWLVRTINMYYDDTDSFCTLLLTSRLHKQTRWQAGGSYLPRKRNLRRNKWFIHPSGILFLPGLHPHTCSGNKSRWDLHDPQHDNFSKVSPRALWGHFTSFRIKT